MKLEELFEAMDLTNKTKTNAKEDKIREIQLTGLKTLLISKFGLKRGKDFDFENYVGRNGKESTFTRGGFVISRGSRYYNEDNKIVLSLNLPEQEKRRIISYLDDYHTKYSTKLIIRKLKKYDNRNVSIYEITFISRNAGNNWNNGRTAKDNIDPQKTCHQFADKCIIFKNGKILKNCNIYIETDGSLEVTKNGKKIGTFKSEEIKKILDTKDGKIKPFYTNEIKGNAKRAKLLGKEGYEEFFSDEEHINDNVIFDY